MRRFLESIVSDALAEDFANEDVTTNATVTPDARCYARLVAKQDGVLSGMKPFHMAFSVMDADTRDWHAEPDGKHFKKGDRLASFTGNTRAVLSAERTAMNFVQHLSGVATCTAAYVEKVKAFDCRVTDTRKTTPLLRQLEKAAVLHGGGANHRHSLLDAILIKDNHITAAGGIAQAVHQVREKSHHLLRIEVEVTNMDEFNQALEAGADVIMLDNMDNDTMREAVHQTDGHPVMLEASGNVNLDRLNEIAATGVDFISVGALTHSSPAVDLSLLIDVQ